MSLYLTVHVVFPLSGGPQKSLCFLNINFFFRSTEKIAQMAPQSHPRPGRKQTPDQGLREVGRAVVSVGLPALYEANVSAVVTLVEGQKVLIWFRPAHKSTWGGGHRFHISAAR